MDPEPYSSAFIHIPKTAGSFLKNVYFKDKMYCMNSRHRQSRSRSQVIADLEHMHGLDLPFEFEDWEFDAYLDHPAYLQNNCIKFSVVRNPFDMLVSLWKHKWPSPRQEWCQRIYDTKYSEFSKFLIDFFSYENIFAPQKNTPLRHNLFFQIFNSSGDCTCDFIIKYENLFDEGLEQIKEISQVSEFHSWKTISKAQYNITQDKCRWQNYYTKDLINLVSKNCKFELESFGYKFDNSYKDFVINTEAIKYQRV